MRKTIFFGSLAWLVGCGPQVTEQDNKLDRSEVPSSHRDFAILGQSYHADQKRFLNTACVTGKSVNTLGNTQAEFELDLDLGFSEVIDRLGGKLSADVTFPVVRAGASARYGQEMAASENVSTYHFSWRMTPKKQVLRPGSYQLTEVGQRYADSSSADLLNKCGNEFVTAIEYGASLNVNLRMEYRNAKDKREIGGKIKVGVGQAIDIVKVEGDLDYLDEEVKKSVKITVQAIQRGGDPIQLLKVVPNNLITCSLEDPSPCFQVFSDAVKYAKEDLINQFEGPESYNVIRYYTERYDESAVEQLTPDSGYPTVDVLVEQARIELDDKFQQALLDQERAAKLSSAYREWLSDEDYEIIKSIEQAAKSNSRLYSNAAVFCYNNPYDGCMERVDNIENQVESYDRQKLSLKAASVNRYFKCEYARLTAIEVGDVSPRFALGYRKRGWAPVFYDNANPEKGVELWTPCEEALESYGEYFADPR
jgi:hypothetical protein